jgi:AmmeMemoRadiSam system protein B
MKIENLQALATNLVKTIQVFMGKKDIAIFASSDMTHHEPKDYQKPQKDIDYQHQKDKAVIDAFEANNWKLMYENAQKTTVCGPQCIATLMLVANGLGYTQFKSLKYYTSYEKMGGSGPCEYSVGYFSGIATIP